MTDIFDDVEVQAANLTPDQIQALRRAETRLTVREAEARAEKFKDDPRPKIISALQELLSENEHLDDSAVVRKMPEYVATAILNNIPVVTLDDTKEMLLYRNGVYNIGAEAFIESVVQESIRNHTSNRFCTEILGHVRRDTFKPRVIFDADPFIINLNNGLYNVDTNQFLDHSPDIYSMAQLPVCYDPDAEIANIDQFLKDVQPDPQERLKLQEFTGYTLWRQYPAQKALLLTGPSGAGRSTFIELVKSLLGEPNISARSLQELQYNRFAAADLYGRLANLYADLSPQAVTDTALFQELTGRDPITGEHKFHDSFTFYNYAKMIFSCNNPPPAPKDDEAYYRRLLMCNFPVVFEGTEHEDREIYNKLTTPQEMSGFLNWALEGLYRLRAYKWHFTNEGTRADIRLDYIRKSDPILAWVEDRVKEDANAQPIPVREIYASIIDYCRSMKLPAPTETAFFKRIKTLVHLNLQYVGPKGEQVRCYAGITLCTVGVGTEGTDSLTLSKVVQQNSGTLDHVLPSVPSVPRLPVQRVHDQPSVPTTRIPSSNVGSEMQRLKNNFPWNHSAGAGTPPVGPGSALPSMVVP